MYFFQRYDFTKTLSLGNLGNTLLSYKLIQNLVGTLKKVDIKYT